MKKWFAFVLLIIVAVGVFVPCCITDNCEANQDLTSKNQNHPLKSPSACSPFFSCASCSGFVASVKVAQLSFSQTVHLKHYERTNSFLLSSYAQSFWQPPQPLS